MTMPVGRAVRPLTRPLMASAARATAAMPEARDLAGFGAYMQDQGASNACGTTSLAMLLSFWAGRPGAYTRTRVDPAIRQFDAPTMPANAAAYAEAQGMRVSLCAGGTLTELERLTKLGVPVQVLIDPDGDKADMGLHWVVVTGVKRDGAGLATHVSVANPAGGVAEDIPTRDFLSRWTDLAVKDVSTGLSRVMLAMVPQHDVPVKGADGVVRPSGTIALPPSSGLGARAWAAELLFDGANLAGQTLDAVGEAGTAAADAARTATTYVAAKAAPVVRGAATLARTTSTYVAAKAAPVVHEAATLARGAAGMASEAFSMATSGARTLWALRPRMPW